MKYVIFILSLFYSLPGVGQEPKPTIYNLYSESLCSGDAMSFGDRAIRFKKILSDSRCPTGDGVACIWAGEVTVLVAFYKDGEFIGEKILAGTNILAGNTEIISKSDISLNEFYQSKEINIRSVIVTPYPEKKHKISQEEYSVELLISEKKESD